MKKVSLLPLLLVVFIGTFGFSLVLPFLVVLVLRYGGNSVIFGVMGSAYAFFQFIAAPMLGRWSDLIGRRRVLLVTQSGTLLSWVIFLSSYFIPINPLYTGSIALFGAFTLTLPLIVIFVARALDGATGGNVSIAHAYLADVVKEEERAKAYGKMGMATNAGFVIGPALGGILAINRAGEMFAIGIAIAISFVALFIIYFLLPESNRHSDTTQLERDDTKRILGQEQRDCYEKEEAKNLTWGQVFQINHMKYFIFMYFVIFLGFNIFYTAFPIHAIEGLSWDAAGLGFYLAALSITMAIVQGVVLPFVSKYVNEANLCIFGTALLGTSFIFLSSKITFILYIAAILFSFGNGLMWPSFLSLLSKAAPAAQQGAIQGFASSSGSLASIAGLLLGGLLYGALGAGTFIVSAIIIFVSFAFTFHLKTIVRSIKQSQPSHPHI